MNTNITAVIARVTAQHIDSQLHIGNAITGYEPGILDDIEIVATEDFGIVITPEITTAMTAAQEAAITLWEDRGSPRDQFAHSRMREIEEGQPIITSRFVIADRFDEAIDRFAPKG